MDRPLITSLVVALSGALLVLPLTAAPPGARDKKAQPGHGKVQPGQKKAPSDKDGDLDLLRKKLEGGEEAAVAALKAIAEADQIAAAPVLAELLGRGANAKIIEEALKTAAKLKLPELSGPVSPYTQHRTDDIRRVAVRTLLKTKGPVAVGTLRKTLRSSDAVVRGTAATGLGELGAKEALPDLFTAFDHGVAEAGAAIGQLCAPDECEKYAERTGRIAFDIMVTGFDQILFRPPSSIPDEQKIRLIGRLRELGTPEAAKYLADVGERWPKEWSAKVKQAIDAAARSVAGGSKK